MPAVLAGKPVGVRGSSALEGLDAKVLKLRLAFVEIRRIGPRVPGLGVPRAHRAFALPAVRGAHREGRRLIHREAGPGGLVRIARRGGERLRAPRAPCHREYRRQRSQDRLHPNCSATAMPRPRRWRWSFSMVAAFSCTRSRSVSTLPPCASRIAAKYSPRSCSWMMGGGSRRRRQAHASSSSRRRPPGWRGSSWSRARGLEPLAGKPLLCLASQPIDAFDLTGLDCEPALALAGPDCCRAFLDVVSRFPALSGPPGAQIGFEFRVGRIRLFRVEWREAPPWSGCHACCSSTSAAAIFALWRRRACGAREHQVRGLVAEPGENRLQVEVMLTCRSQP